jgi:hypothetical protein
MDGMKNRYSLTRLWSTATTIISQSRRPVGTVFAALLLLAAQGCLPPGSNLGPPITLIRVSGFRGDELTGEAQRPSSLLGNDFGSVYSGATVKRQITVSSTGTLALQVEVELKIQGSGFSIDGPLTANLGPQGRQRYLLSFAPADVGDYSATFMVRSNAANRPALSVPLHGRCIPHGTSHEYSLTVKNLASALAYDANDDGRLDVLAWQGDSMTVSTLVFINDGAGNFVEQTNSILKFGAQSQDGTPTTIRYVDLLNEGKVGVLMGFIGKEDSSGPYGGRIHYLYPDGSGHLLDRTDLFGSYWAETEDLDVADVDGDGQNEIYATQCPGGHAVINPVILKYGGGGFAQTRNGMTPEMTSGVGYFCSVNFLDISGKGLSDLFLGFRNSYYGNGPMLDTVAFNNGAGVFSLGTRAGMPASRSVFHWASSRSNVGDMDGDGLADIVDILMPEPWEPGKASVLVLLNRGGGQFVDGSSGLPTYFADYFRASFSGIDRLYLIDANHDGRMDILVTGNYIKPTLWTGLPGGGFALERIFGSGGNYPQMVLPGDFDGDGTTDFVLIYY